MPRAIAVGSLGSTRMAASPATSGIELTRDVTTGAPAAIVWLQYCNAAGELLGYATGPGDSPNQLF